MNCLNNLINRNLLVNVVIITILSIVVLSNAQPVAASEPVFQEFQAIPTEGASDWEYFTIEGHHYLAVAHYGNASTDNLNSRIYKWNGSSFVEFQQIPTHGAGDWEFFTIGNDHYLAVVNGYNGSNPNLDSIIYRWDGTTFVQFQAIPTHGAKDWEFFTINNAYYLVVANHWSGFSGSYDINSTIYQWNGSNFVVYQSIATHAAFDWEHFMIGNDHYLAVANHHSGTYGNINFNVDSKIYQWDGFNFVEHQTIATHSAHDWAYFTIDNDHYLAVANQYNGPVVDIDSIIYQWNGSSFVEFQAIGTHKATDWQYFNVNGISYLVVANGTQASIIYRWDGNSFVEFQTIDTNGEVKDWESFILDGQLYLAAANYVTGNNFATNSPIYQGVISSCPSPSPEHLVYSTFEEDGLAGWELPYPGIVLANDANHMAECGQYGVRFDGRGRMDRTFATTPGQTYQVSAWIRIDDVITSPTWGGVLLQAVDIPSWQVLKRGPFLNTGSHPFGEVVSLGEWYQVAFSFEAIGPMSRIVYQNFSNGEFVTSADEFMVVSVAENQGTVTATSSKQPYQYYMPLTTSGHNPEHLTASELAELLLEWEIAWSNGQKRNLPVAIMKAYGIKQ